MDLANERVLAVVHSLCRRLWPFRVRRLHSVTSLLASGSVGLARERQRLGAGGSQSEQGLMKRRRRASQQSLTFQWVADRPRGLRMVQRCRCPLRWCRW